MTVKVYAAQSEPEAGIVESLLRANGSHPIVYKSSFIGRGGADQYFYVEASEDEADAVRRLLKDYEAENVVGDDV